MTRYNKELLEECLKRDNATLIGDYEKLTSRSYITFKCSCGEEGEKRFENILNKGKTYCKKCTSRNALIKFENTCIERYGNINPFQNDEIKNKIKQNNLIKTGYDHHSKRPEIKEKIKNTYKERTGYENPMKNPENLIKTKNTYKEKTGYDYPLQNPNVKEKMKYNYKEKTGYDCPLSNPEIILKSKKTYKEKTGYDNPSKNPEVIEKKMINCIIKTGYKNYSQIPEIKEKVKEMYFQNSGYNHPLKNPIVKEKVKSTNLKNRGVEYPTQCKEVKEKVKSTNLERYGFEYATQSAEVMDKQIKSSYSKKEYVLPSGNKIYVQGYEPLALDILINEWKVEENDIITERINVPEIWWKDKEDKTHRYYPDIFIPSKNLIIEVKSTWTYQKDKSNTQYKLIASKELGYSTLLWVFDNKKYLENEYKDSYFEEE